MDIDASDNGIGAVCLQRLDKENKIHPSSEELCNGIKSCYWKNGGTSQREAAYLVLIWIDHNNLHYIHGAKGLAGKLDYSFLDLIMFCFTIQGPKTWCPNSIPAKAWMNSEKHSSIFPPDKILGMFTWEIETSIIEANRMVQALPVYLLTVSLFPPEFVVK